MGPLSTSDEPPEFKLPPRAKYTFQTETKRQTKSNEAVKSVPAFNNRAPLEFSSESAPFEEHQQVILKSDIESEGLKAGATGTIVHVYRGARAYEVEFVAPQATEENKVITVLSAQIEAKQ